MAFDPDDLPAGEITARRDAIVIQACLERRDDLLDEVRRRTCISLDGNLRVHE